jgi:S1-C subfamily serine protease
MLIDVIIVVFVVLSIIHGRRIGFVQQFLLAVGFITGLFIGGKLQPFVLSYTDTVLSRALVSLIVIIGLATIVGRIGESVGMGVKRRLQQTTLSNKIDGILGSIAGFVTVLASVWLLTPLLSGLPAPSLQRAIQSSNIVSKLNDSLPSSPQFISSFGRLINPNGFPDVFVGLDRQPLKPDAPLPSLGELQTAVQQTRPSIVKLEGRGCGGIVEGSGFIAGEDIVMTNAHVVAGVTKPIIVDTEGEHDATVIWFDPSLDVAILRTDGLVGKPLTIKTENVPRGTASVVVGYPGGGGFTASPSVILDQFAAEGRDIYSKNLTNRDLYELKADIIPGNSGGPVLDKEGTVIGLVFAESTTYDDIGYALTMNAVAKDLHQALQRNQAVSTGACAVD